MRERLSPWATRFYEQSTLKYRTRSARIKFWWTRAAPVGFCMGAGAEWYKWTYQDKYRQFRYEGGTSLRPSAYEKEMYQHYLEKHGTDVMDADYQDRTDPDVQLVIDTIIKENVEASK